MIVYLSLLFLSLAAIVAVEVPRLVRGRLWWELVVFAIILAVAYTLVFLKVVRVV